MRGLERGAAVCGHRRARVHGHLAARPLTISRICDTPFLPVTHLFDACAPAMAAFSPPLTHSERVPKIIFVGDRPAPHAQLGLRGPDRPCYPCAVDENPWQDAKIYATSEERCVLHHFLRLHQWRGTGASLREALAKGHFQMAHETGSAVRPPGESATPSAKRARLL